jgi:hypothetical protein
MAGRGHPGLSPPHSDGLEHEDEVAHFVASAKRDFDLQVGAAVSCAVGGWLFGGRALSVPTHLAEDGASLAGIHADLVGDLFGGELWASAGVDVFPDVVLRSFPQGDPFAAHGSDATTALTCGNEVLRELLVSAV